MANKNTNESTYRIGTVSKLTGIPTETLRVWERRYKLTEPLRSEGGNRLYTQKDLNKLRLIKHLVNNGHAIGTIAHLSIQQLEERLEESHSPLLTTQKSLKKPLNIVLVGHTFPIQFKKNIEYLDKNKFDLSGIYSTLEDAFNQTSEKPCKTDILILEISNITDQAIKDIISLKTKLNAVNVVISYTFSKQQHKQLLEKYRFTLIRHPSSWDELIRACYYAYGTYPQQTAKEDTSIETNASTIYTEKQLAEAKTLTLNISGEYNHHLSDLIISLARFEEYTQQCSIENQEDAAMHSFVSDNSAKARYTLEKTLKRLFEIEGVSLA